MEANTKANAGKFPIHKIDEYMMQEKEQKGKR